MPADISETSEMEIYLLFKAAKKTKGMVPGDLPARLRNKLDLKLAKPAKFIFDCELNCQMANTVAIRVWNLSEES